MIRFLVVFLVALALPAQAKTPQPPDFAWKSVLRFLQGGSLYEVRVPLSVYRGVTSPELADLCVFNGANEIVPFSVATPATQKQAANRIILPHFALPRKPKADESLSVRVERRSSGAVVTVGNGTNEGLGAAYLLDATAATAPIDSITLEWRDRPDGFTERVTVEASDDLDHWREVASATLASLKKGGRVVEQRQIALDGVRARYLRIVPEDVRMEMELTKVTASLSTGPTEPTRERLTVSGTAVAGQPGEFLFDLTGRMPVDRVRVLLPEKNSIARAIISSRTREEAPWIRRQDAVVYRLDTKGGELSAPEFTVCANGDRYWRLQIDAAGGGIGTGELRIAVAWVPHRVLFVPRGTKPFSLTFGSGRADTRAIRGGDLLARLPGTELAKTPVVPAEAGETMTLGGSDALKTEISAVTKKKALLWLVLLAGVGVLAWMAARLFRQMKDNG